MKVKCVESVNHSVRRTASIQPMFVITTIVLFQHCQICLFTEIPSALCDNTVYLVLIIATSN